MSSPRLYTVDFAAVSVSAVQDLIAIYCGASMAIELRSIVIGQVQNAGVTPAVQNLSFTIKRLAATVTAGSGGSTPTPAKVGRGNAAATATAHANDTVQATSSGTTTVLFADSINTVNGYQMGWTGEGAPDAGLSEALVFSLNTAPAAAMIMSGTLTFAEKF